MRAYSEGGGPTGRGRFGCMIGVVVWERTVDGGFYQQYRTLARMPLDRAPNTG